MCLARHPGRGENSGHGIHRSTQGVCGMACLWQVVMCVRVCVCMRACVCVCCRNMPQPNQIHVRRDDVHVTAADLLSLKGMGGAITEKV